MVRMEAVFGCGDGLTPDESSMLDSLLYELKMKYVCFTKK